MAMVWKTGLGRSGLGLISVRTESGSEFRPNQSGPVRHRTDIRWTGLGPVRTGLETTAGGIIDSEFWWDNTWLSNEICWTRPCARLQNQHWVLLLRTYRLEHRRAKYKIELKSESLKLYVGRSVKDACSIAHFPHEKLTVLAKVQHYTYTQCDVKNANRGKISSFLQVFFFGFWSWILSSFLSKKLIHFSGKKLMKK